MKLFRKHTFMTVLSLAAALAITLSFVGCDPKKKGDTSSTVSDTQSSEMQSKAESSSKPQSSEPPSSEESSSETTAPVDAVIIDAETAELLGDLTPYENEMKGWGQGRQVNDENRPLTCDLYQPKYEEQGGLFIMPNTEKNIYLTFDEGYENGYTEKILDVLKEKECPAVFFVTTPYVKGNPELIKRMLDEGHVIGNHSVNHKSMPTLTPQEQVDEIAGLHNYMVENYNYQMTLFRPPMGEWSTQSMYIANKLGYKTVLWSFAYLDYDVKNQPDKATAFERVTTAAHNGAVYLLHAVSQTNTEMLAEVVDKLREDGYSLEKLS